MSHRITIFDTTTLATSTEKMAVERFHFNPQNPKLPDSLARFRKPRTTTSSNTTTGKTGAELPVAPSSFDKVDRTQSTTPGNIDADIDNDNGNNTTCKGSFSSNSEVTLKRTESNVSSKTSLESGATTEIGSTDVISNDNSKLTVLCGKVKKALLLDLNFLAHDQNDIAQSEPPSERPLGRPSPLGPTIRPSSESLSQRSSQGSLPTLESTVSHPGTKLNERNPSTAIEASELGHKPKKDPTSKFKRFFKRLTRSQPTIHQHIAAAPTPKLWDTVYDGSDDWDLIEEKDHNQFALNLPPQISRDESELDYLRRTQEEECLEFNKRRLFATKRGLQEI